MKNYLFLDIDGVLNAWGAYRIEEHKRAWTDYERVDDRKFAEIVSARMINELNHLISVFSINVVWVTTWERKAPEFGQKIGLEGAENWPWLYVADRNGIWGKQAAIQEFISQEPELQQIRPRAIWIDDDLGKEHDAAFWATEQGILTITPNVWNGITPAMIVEMKKFLARQNGIATSNIAPAPAPPVSIRAVQQEPNVPSGPLIGGTD